MHKSGGAAGGSVPSRPRLLFEWALLVVACCAHYGMVAL